MRIISDEDFNGMLKVLLQNEQVALFQNLLLSKKTEPTDENKGTEWTTTE